MNISVKKGVVELAQELLDKNPFSADKRPPTHELRRVEVIDEFEESDTYVEMRLEIHKNGEKCEPLTIEYHPHVYDNEWSIPGFGGDVVRVLQSGRLDDGEKEQYEVFGAVVGRLAYHED